MYEQHFGLRSALFESAIARDGSVFLGARFRAVVEHIEIASTTPDSALVLYGAAGLGKTTVAAHALRAAGTRLAIGWLATAPKTTEDLLELLLGEFGFEAQNRRGAERLQAWRQYLRELGATDTRATIAVEDAGDWPASLLQALESLTRADPNGSPGTHLLLMGSEELCAMLDDPLLRNLKQRVRLRQRFTPLEAAETEAYLVHSVTMAGGDFDRVFGPGAAAAAHAYTRGVPRLINNVCETALALAARREAPAVTANLIALAAVELCGLPPLGRRSSRIETQAAPETPESPAWAPAPERLDVAEGIPTLTDCVELDLDSGAYPLLARGEATRATTAGFGGDSDSIQPLPTLKPARSTP